jgi:hypothetical protein
MEYYIYNIPLQIINEVEEGVNIPEFCLDIEELIPPSLLYNVEIIYVGQFEELQGRNALFSNGAIYMTSAEPTNFDMIENFIHEVAHSFNERYGWQIYDDALKQEFLGKRGRLYSLLTAEGYHINPGLYGFTEYNPKFDEFLAHEVGYPTLLSLTIGLFVSPYGATSLEEYFANGFEKYFLENPQMVADISPVLFQKIEDILNDQE